MQAYTGGPALTLPLYLIAMTLGERGTHNRIAKNYSPQNTEDYHSPPPSEKRWPGGAPADSTLLFSALQQHAEDQQTLLWAVVQFPRLTLFL